MAFYSPNASRNARRGRESQFFQAFVYDNERGNCYLKGKIKEKHPLVDVEKCALCPQIGTAAFMGALAEAERRFHAMIELSLQAKFVLRRFRPIFANEAAATMFGFDSAAAIMIRTDISNLFDEETQANPDRAWRWLVSGPSYGRRLFTRRDGAVFRGEFAARPIEWDGELAVAIAVLDVSDQERAERDARDALNFADAATRAKRRFMAAASHQLRTPLHVALGRLQLLTERNLEPGAGDLADGALAACRRLLFSIDDVLDAAALETGSIALVREPFDPAKSIQIAVAAVRDDGPDTRIELRLPARSGMHLMGDSRRVGRIAAAFLEEALRRRPPGAVVLDASWNEEGLTLSVSAPGATGAPSLPDLSQTQPVEPIAMARALATAMDGMLVEHVGAASGWSASVFLPLLEATPAPQAIQKNLDVLVVEDNAANRKLIELVLKALGHTVHLACDGVEGVAAVARRRFDLVLMDLAMPSLDGFEATRRIRKLAVEWSTLPIAALTASCTPGVQEAVAEAGMDAFLQKPLELPRLAEAIAMLTQNSVQAAEINRIKNQDHNQKQADNADGEHEERPYGNMRTGF